MKKRFNWQTICNDLVSNLPSRTKDVLVQRFGLSSPVGQQERRTLESIGREGGITRERVRQIEEGGLKRVRELEKKTENAFRYFEDRIQEWGGLKREDSLISELAPSGFKNQVLFLLTVGGQFERFKETTEFYPFWTVDPNSVKSAQRVIDSFRKRLCREDQPLALAQYIKKESNLNLPLQVLSSYLEISKQILRNSEGLYGFSNWPEINPRGIRDKTYLVLKTEKRPLHFTQVAKLISQSALPQTVHNELIRDPRFVLVGRGLYALGEWGYRPGTVQKVIKDVLIKANGPLSKREILKEVLKQRLVKQNTVFLNLENKKYFLKAQNRKYTIREV